MARAPTAPTALEPASGRAAVSMEDLLRRIVLALEQAGVPYMLTGSLASSYYGEGRGSQDIDIVIAPDEAGLRRFVASLPATTYYVDEETALDAFRRRAQFNVIDMHSGFKVDLILRRERDFSRAEFERRLSVDAMGMRLNIATAEDIIIAKLEWAKAGASERQLEDVAGILRDPESPLDMSYLERWVRDLGVSTQWARARELAREKP